MLRGIVLLALVLTALAVLGAGSLSQAAPRGNSQATAKPAPLTKAWSAHARVVGARKRALAERRHRAAKRRARQRARRHRRASLGQRAARLAFRYLGVPYRWGGASPRSGFDCSGLVQYVYGRLGFRLPHYTGSQFRYGRRVHPSWLKAGDLVFFSGLGHVGLYVGKGRFIDAPHSGAVVRVNSLRGRLSSFVGARLLGAPV
jgi:cell wall-associated NlpC family hydrolase